MSLLKRIESARPGPEGAGGAGPGAGSGGPGGSGGAATPRLIAAAPGRESFRDVKFRVQSRVIQDLDPKLDLSNQVEVRRQI
jgi:pilus assembly protein CpaF